MSEALPEPSRSAIENERSALEHRALFVRDRRMFTTARLREDLRPAGLDHGSRAVRHAVRIAS